MNLEAFLTREPLSQMISLRWKFKPWGIFLTLLTLNLLLEVLPGYVLGFWRTTSDAIGVIDDLPNLVNILLIIPSSWALFLWLPSAIVDCFNRLCEHGIVSPSEKQKLRTRLSQFLNVETSKRYRFSVFIFAAIITVIGLYITANLYKPPAWYTLGWYFWLIFSPRVFLNFYVILNAVLWCAQIVIWLSTIFNEFRINVFPYHEDGAGGLRFIGQMIFGMSRISLVLGFFLISEVFGVLMRKQSFLQINIIAELIAFPIITIISFVVPLLSCRDSMKRSKEADLRKLGNQIQNLFEKISKGNQEAKDINRLLSLTNLRTALIKDYPILPVDTSILQGFLVRVFGSFLPAIIGFGIEVYKIFK